MPHGGAGPGAPLQGRPPPPAAAVGGREASPPALQASLPRRPSHRLRQARRARLRTHRRGDSLPQPAGPGQAHVRGRPPRRRYATMAAEAELVGVPPSLPGLRSLAGAGTLRGLSGPRGRARAAGERGGSLADSRVLCGARSRLGGELLPPWSSLGAGGGSGGGVRRRQRQVTSDHPRTQPWRVLTGSTGLPAVPRGRGCPAPGAPGRPRSPCPAVPCQPPVGLSPRPAWPRV